MAISPVYFVMFGFPCIRIFSISRMISLNGQTKCSTNHFLLPATEAFSVIKLYQQYAQAPRMVNVRSLKMRLISSYSFYYAKKIKKITRLDHLVLFFFNATYPIYFCISSFSFQFTCLHSPLCSVICILLPRKSQDTTIALRVRRDFQLLT